MHTPEFKITPTLLNSFLYLQGIKKDELKKEEEKNFIKKLNKERTPSNIAMDRGNEFESLIEDRTKDIQREDLIIKHLKEIDRDKLLNNIDELAEIVKGGEWQAKVEKPLVSDKDKTSYLVYGKTDVLKSNIIYDIKYTQKKRANKFSTSTQHRIYLYCTNINQFSYLVSDGNEWWREDFYRHPTMDSQFILNIIEEMRTWINKREEAKAAFEKNWKI